MTLMKRVAFLTAASLMLLNGCGGGGTEKITLSRSYLGTQAPGDAWDWSITPNSFTATNNTNGYTYSGTATALSTGFLKLQVQSTTDPSVTVGMSAYAVELPSTALLIKPVGSDTAPPIVAAGLGTNPPGPQVTFNWVKVPRSGWTIAEEAYGYVTFDVSGNTYTGTSHRYQIDGTPMSDSASNFIGDHGRMTELYGPQGVTATGSMTPSGVCAIDYGPNLGGVIGVRQPPSAYDMAALGNKTYKGFLIAGGKTQCVRATPNGDGTLHGAGYENPSGVETGTLDGGSGVTVTFISQPNPGLVRITLTSSGDTEDLAACVNTVDGKTMLFGFALGSDKPYNVVLVEE